jgi:RNA polymerase sigma-70 factor, ECF subfamily
LTDAELALALQSGDPDAQRAVWSRFLPVVNGMVRRRIGRSGDGDDVVQEVFLAVFRSMRLLRNPVALRAFVLTITARTLNREGRRRITGFYPTLWSDDQVEELVSDRADPTSKHAYSVLKKLVSRLRARERRAFTLRFLAGMDAAEVADALGVSTPTARRALSRANRRIKLWASRDPFLADYLNQH